MYSSKDLTHMEGIYLFHAPCNIAWHLENHVGHSEDFWGSRHHTVVFLLTSSQEIGDSPEDDGTKVQFVS